MGLFKNDKSIPFHVYLRDYFLSLEKADSSPSSVAWSSLKEIENGSRNNEEMAYYILEDIIYCSLSCTYIEQVLLAIKEAPALTIPIIEKYQADLDKHEQEL